MPALANRRRRRQLRKKFSSKKGKTTALGGYPAQYGKTPPSSVPKPPPAQPPRPAPQAQQTYRPGTPARPGQRSPTVQPFMTAQDMIARAAAEADFATRMADLDFNLASLQSKTDYEKTNIEKGRIEDTADTNDEMAARGIFQSSIRDADLFDIDATAAIRKNFLDRELDAATLNTQNQKVIAQKAWDAFQAGLNQQMVENARAAAEGMPEWLREPVPGTPGRFVPLGGNRPTVATPGARPPGAQQPTAPVGQNPRTISRPTQKKKNKKKGGKRSINRKGKKHPSRPRGSR